MLRKFAILLLLLAATLAAVSSLPLVWNVDTVQRLPELNSLGSTTQMLAGEHDVSHSKVLVKRDGGASAVAEPPSTNREMARLLRPGALAGTRDNLLISTIDVNGRLLAVTLPGRGLDAGVINRMMQQDKDFLVEGAGGKLWHFINQGGRKFKPISLPAVAQLDRFESLRSGPVLVASPFYPLAAGRARSSIGSQLWARVRGLFNKLPKSVQAVPRLTKRGAGASDPPSTDREMSRLLRPEALGAPAHDRLLLSTRPVFGGEYLAVQLPGNGWDAQVINRMLQQDKHFFVEGKDGKVWQFVNTGDRKFQPRALSQSDMHFFKDAPVRSGSSMEVPTYVHPFDEGSKGSFSRVWDHIRGPFLKLPDKVQAVPVSQFEKRADTPSMGRAVEPPSTNYEMARLLRAEVLGRPVGGEVAIKPIAVLDGHFLAVKLPGNGWDASVINRMMQQDKHFFVEGKGGRIWQFVNRGERNFRPVYMPQPELNFVRNALVHAEPTVRVPNHVLGAESLDDSRLSRLWGRVRNALTGLPKSVEAVHVVRKRAWPEVDRVVAPPSTNGEMARLLRPESLRSPLGKVVVEPIEVQGLLAVKLPGGGWDGAVLNTMMQQNRDFKVQGKDDRVWQFVHKGRRTFAPRYVPAMRGLLDGTAQRPTVTMPKYVQYQRPTSRISRVWTRVKNLFTRLPTKVRPT